MLMKDHASEIEQVSCLFRLILRDFHVFGRHFLSQKGLTFPQYHVLSFLGEQKESRMRSLKEYLAVTGPMVTGIVDNLVEKKLVVRGRWGQDRREVHVYVTRRGKVLVKDLEFKKKKLLGVLFDVLSFEDRQNLLRILNHLSISLVEQNSALKAGRL